MECGAWGPTDVPGDSVEPCAPAVEDLVDVGSYSITRLRAVDARHQQVVVVGVAVTHRRHHREWIAAGPRARPAAVRPTLPLLRSPVCVARERDTGALFSDD